MFAGTVGRFTLAAGIIAGLAGSQIVAAGQIQRAHAFVSMVADVHRDAPDDGGLLPTAVAEAQTAAQYAKAAAKATDLAAIKLNTGYVLNAIDPRQMAEGPGLGFGVKRAAAESATAIETAAKTEGATPNIVTHAQHIATSAKNTVARCDKIAAVAKQILASTSVPEATKLAAQLSTIADQLIPGADANGDGQIGWQENEGGLKQAQDHLALLKKAENLP